MSSAVSGFPMSPATLSTLASVLGSIESALATTVNPASRYAATRPAPIPCEAPVIIATFLSITPVANRTEL